MLNVSYAKRLLENYSLNKAAEENFPYEMTMINSRLYSSCSEKTMVEMIEAKDRLVARTDRAKKEIKQTESALGALSPYQRELLNAFYVAGAHSGAEISQGGIMWRGVLCIGTKTKPFLLLLIPLELSK